MWVRKTLHLVAGTLLVARVISAALLACQEFNRQEMVVNIALNVKSFYFKDKHVHLDHLYIV